MAMYKLKAKCGNHIGPPDAKGKRITYKAGDTVPSDTDLVAKFPNKFRLLSPDEYENAKTAPNIPMPRTKKKSQSQQEHRDMEEPEIPDSEYGIDVSSEFPTASKVKLQVFEKSKWFTVVDPDNNEVLNEKKLRRARVEPFLADYEEEAPVAKEDKNKDMKEPIVDEEDTDDEDEDFEDDTDDEEDDDEE